MGRVMPNRAIRAGSITDNWQEPELYIPKNMRGEYHKLRNNSQGGGYNAIMALNAFVEKMFLKDEPQTKDWGCH